MTILYINNEHCFSLEQLKQYFSNDVQYGDRVFYDLIDSAPKDISNWLREHNEYEMAEKIEKIDTNLGSTEYLSQLCFAITSDESCSQYLKSIKPDFLSCFELKDFIVENSKDCTKIDIQLKISRRVKEIYELKITTSWGTRAFFINPWDYEEDEFVTKDFVLIKRQNIEIGEICLFADNQLIKKVNHKNNVSKEISSSSDTQNEEKKNNSHVIPIYYVNEEIIKHWLTSFSRTKYLSLCSDSECIDKEKLQNFLNTTYGINCDLVSAKSCMLSEFIEYAVADIEQEIQKKFKTSIDIGDHDHIDNKSFSFFENVQQRACLIHSIIFQNSNCKFMHGRSRILEISLNIESFNSDLNDLFGFTLSKKEIYRFKNVHELVKSINNLI